MNQLITGCCLLRSAKGIRLAGLRRAIDRNRPGCLRSLALGKCEIGARTASLKFGINELSG
jgi:hypothetical protein